MERPPKAKRHAHPSRHNKSNSSEDLIDFTLLLRGSLSTPGRENDDIKPNCSFKWLENELKTEEKVEEGEEIDS